MSKLNGKNLALTEFFAVPSGKAGRHILMTELDNLDAVAGNLEEKIKLLNELNQSKTVVQESENKKGPRK